MSAINLYATLADYKGFSVARGQTATVDANDDAVILQLLEAASRYLDDKCDREFFPTILQRVYNLPSPHSVDARNRRIWFNADALEITTVLNGDGSTITSDKYTTDPNNYTPYYSLNLRDTSGIFWLPNGNFSRQQVIKITGVWGYHNRYLLRGWSVVGTLGAAITDTTTLAFTASSGHSITVGQIVKIDSEYYNIAVVATNTITPIQRGDNGSTAATHTNGTTVYAYNPMPEARNAVLEITLNAYKRRFGVSLSMASTITGSGIVLSPRDIPAMATEFIGTFRRRTP